MKRSYEVKEMAQHVQPKRSNKGDEDKKKCEVVMCGPSPNDDRVSVCGWCLIA